MRGEGRLGHRRGVPARCAAGGLDEAGRGEGHSEQREEVVAASIVIFFFSSRRRHTRCSRDWSSDVCSSDLPLLRAQLNDGPALCIADRLIVPVGPATAFLQSIHAQLAVTLNPLVGRLAADAVAPAQLAQRRTTAQVVGYEEQFLVHGCALLPGHGDRSLAAVGSSCQAWICYPCPCTDVSPMSVSRTGRLL